MNRNKFIGHFFSFFLIFIVPFTSVCAVEEGWRYHANFKLSVRHNDVHQQFDLTTLHHSMAMVVTEAEKLAESFGKAYEGRVTNILRFTPIIMEDGKIKLGTTVTLADNSYCTRVSVPYLPQYEIAFVSGFHDLEKSMPQNQCHIKGVSLITKEKEEQNAFALFPPYNLDKRPSAFCRFPIKPLFRDHFDFELFSRNIDFRYPDSAKGTCFDNKNYIKLYNKHLPAKRNIEERSKRIEKELSKFKQIAFDSSSRTSQFDDAAKKVREAALGFNNSPEANSYTCAEQTSLDFIQDINVVEYLKNSLEVLNPNFIGLIAHSHSSQTPCSTCCTSYAREMEKSGIFQQISNGKPTMIFCSCSKHYERKSPMLPYEETTFLENFMDRAIEMNLTEPVLFRVPIVLLEYQIDKDLFEIGTGHYNTFKTKHDEDLQQVPGEDLQQTSRAKHDEDLQQVPGEDLQQTSRAKHDEDLQQVPGEDLQQTSKAKHDEDLQQVPVKKTKKQKRRDSRPFKK